MTRSPISRPTSAPSPLRRRKKAAKNAFDDALVDQAVENMTVDMPEGMIEERMDGIVREYAQYMANQGIRIDDYLKMIGTDMKTFREACATAEKQARTEVLLRRCRRSRECPDLRRGSAG